MSYVQKMIELAAKLNVPLGGVSELEVRHDDDCGVWDYDGGRPGFDPCTCEPDFYYRGRRVEP